MVQTRRPPNALLRTRLLAEGGTDAEVRAKRRRGEWRNLRPGAYLPGEAAAALTPEQRHRLLIDTIVPALGSGSTVSHASAALLLGLPVWGISLRRIHLTRPIASGGNRSTSVHVHAAARESVPMAMVGGIAVTSPALTVVDVARTVPFEQGVAVADAALHAKLVTPEELVSQLEWVTGRIGAGRARAVVGFADGRSESVGESRSRVALARSGIRLPDLQIEVQDERGRHLARCDFGYPDLLIAGEFDGRVKYGRLLRPGQSAGDVVFDEKRREDALRDRGWIVIRWVWNELATPEVVVARWERALERAQRHR